MSAGKHTPGPWVVYTPEDYDGPESLPGLGVEAENGDAVVWSALDAEEGIKRDADARLIAAAPELLGALRGLRDCIQETRGKNAYDAVEAADAAIAKAEGKT